MLADRDHILIGLSGGPDSVSLTLILDELRAEYNLTLSALYIDHGLRPGETEKEESFCRELCESRGINFYTRAVDVRSAAGAGTNIQQAARQLRYKAYDEDLHEIKASKIALGHNADDQAETVMMRLLRGSGRKGLSGIPPVRGNIIRPLIEIERREIEDFLVSYSPTPQLPNSSTSYLIDSSNLKDDYLRNWIRLNFMAELKTKNPALVHDICNTADIFREEDAYLEIIVTKTLMRLISRKSDYSIQLFLTPLAATEKPILRRVLRRAIDAVKGLRGISYVHIEDIIHLIQKGKAGDRLNLPKGIRVVREYSLLKITTEKPELLSEHELSPPGEIVLRESGISLKASFEEGGESGKDVSSVLLDAGNMTFPLKVRARAAGDYFYPLGFGKKKKLQDFFVDEKVPRDRRDVTPIVVSGNDIIWIAGYRADERFKVTEGTESILKLSISELEKH